MWKNVNKLEPKSYYYKSGHVSGIELISHMMSEHKHKYNKSKIRIIPSKVTFHMSVFPRNPRRHKGFTTKSWKDEI